MASDTKITVNVPEDLLREAQEATGEGITATVRRGLQLVASQSTSRDLRRLRGQVRFSIQLDQLREDRG
jgi:hypothetical protein